MFLASAALSGWIKWQGFQLPAVLITILLGLGIVYLAQSSSSYIAHLVTTARSPQVHEGGRARCACKAACPSARGRAACGGPCGVEGSPGR